MATKKVKEAAAEKPATKKDEKKSKAGKKELTAEEKKAKREAMKERLKNRPEGQRPNSKQCDIFDFADHGKVEVYGANIRKFGVVLTSIAFDKDGNVIGTSITTVPGHSVKSKKGHGILVPKVPGMGKKSKESADIEDEEDMEEEEE